MVLARPVFSASDWVGLRAHVPLGRMSKVEAPVLWMDVTVSQQLCDCLGDIGVISHGELSWAVLAAQVNWSAA